MTFALDLARFAEKAQEKADEAVAGIVYGIAASVDNLSPVGDATYWKNPPPPGYVGGRFRANWMLGVDVMPTGTTTLVDTSAKGLNGGTTTARIAAAIPDDAAGHIYYLANNLPYAQALEHGHSRQAPGPSGIVGRTQIRFQQIVRDAVEAGK